MSLEDSNGYIPINSVREDFALSRLTSQIRYRWEIGPLSDFFLVYTRGSNLPNRVEESHGEPWEDAISYPIVILTWPNLDIVLGTNICQTLSLIESFSLNSRFKNLPEAFLGNGSSMNQTYFGTLKLAMRFRQCS